MKNTPISEIIAENERRKRKLDSPYDPELGIGCCGERVPVVRHGVTYLVPAEMPCRGADALSDAEWDLRRFAHDFEYWCAKCITIKDKTTCRDRMLVLNAPQRRMLAVLEQMRRQQRPIRLIMLKARQWGGSALSILLIYLKMCILVEVKCWFYDYYKNKTIYHTFS